MLNTDNLIHTYYEPTTDTYELEFKDAFIKDIPSEQHPFARIDEYYWDDQRHIDEAVVQGETIHKYRISDDFGSKGLDKSDFEDVVTDSYGYYTTDKDNHEWIEEILYSYDVIDDCDDLITDYWRYITEYDDYITLARHIEADDYDNYKDHLKYGITADGVKKYLEGYDFTTSTQTDKYFNMFKCDVYNMAEDFLKGDAYVADIQDYIDWLEHEMHDADEDEAEAIESILEEVKDFQERGYKIVIDRFGQLEYI